MIKNNCHKYSVSAMCKVLQISRSTYYYEAQEKLDESMLVKEFADIFIASRNNYGTRKIKVELHKRGFQVSRRRIGRIMRDNNYTTAQFKPHTAKCNQDKIENVVSREFANQPPMKVVVSDLTYIRVGLSWHYICILVDLFNREIIGYSAGRNKNAELLKSAFGNVNGNLSDIQIFHTDEGVNSRIKRLTRHWEPLRLNAHLVKKDVRMIMLLQKRHLSY